MMFNYMTTNILVQLTPCIRNILTLTFLTCSAGVI